MEAPQLPLLSPPEEVGGDELEEVVVSENMMVEIGSVMARDGGKTDDGIYADGQGERAATAAAAPAAATATWCSAPDPWPPPMSADLDESNSEREIGRHDFVVFVLGGRATAGSLALGKCIAKGDRSDREQDGSDWEREGIDTGWSFSIFGGWEHETPARRLTRPRRTRVRENG